MLEATESRRSAAAKPAMRTGRPLGWAAALAAAMLVLAHCLIAWRVRPPGVLTGVDDALYLLLARGIGHFDYRNLLELGRPRHGLYPPGYPLLLALWQAVVGRGFDAAILLNILCSAGALVLTWLLMRDLLPEGVALAGLAAIALNPALINAAAHVQSEPAFMFFTLLVMWLVVRRDGSARGATLAGSTSVLAALTRAAGVTLPIALGLRWALDRRWRRVAALLAGTGLFVGGWIWWIATAPGQFRGHSYIADATVGDKPLIPRLLDRLVSHPPAYLGRSLPASLAVPAIPGTPIDNVIGVGLLVGGLAAGVVVLLRRRRLEPLFLGTYMALLFVWPWIVTRFVEPLGPLVILTSLVGGWHVLRRHARRGVAIAVPLLAMLTLAGSGAWRSARLVAARSSCIRGAGLPDPSCVRPDQASFFEALRFIRAATPRDAVFLSAKGPTVGFYTGRRYLSPRYPLAAGPEGFLRFMRENGVDYVLLGSLHVIERKRLLPVLERVCESLEVTRYFAPRTYLLRVAPADRPPGRGNACQALRDYRRSSFGRFGPGD